MKTYRVNNIFYSLQGEGRNTGRAAVFVRFAGCNLRCPFCDTEFDTYTEMTAEEIIAKAASLHPSSPTLPSFIVLTGGEPTLQVDEAFVDLLHNAGYEVAMESNGTRPAPQNLDWLTVSPKERGERREERGERIVERGERLPDEVKVVFDEHTDPDEFLTHLSSQHISLSSLLSPLSSSHSPFSSPHTPLLYLQPCDTGDAQRNEAITQACVDYIKQHPQWRLSLQTHKLIGIE